MYFDECGKTGMKKRKERVVGAGCRQGRKRFPAWQQPSSSLCYVSLRSISGGNTIINILTNYTSLTTEKNKRFHHDKMSNLPISHCSKIKIIVRKTSNLWVNMPGYWGGYVDRKVITTSGRSSNTKARWVNSNRKKRCWPLNL